MTSTLNLELRANIKFCANLGYTPTQTKTLIEKGMKAECGRTLVFKWHERFTNGRENLNDNARTGRPKSVSRCVKQNIVDLLAIDRRVTIREIARDVGASLNTVHRILREDLGMRKVSARWVPRLLSADDKSQPQLHVNFCAAFARREKTF